MLNTKKVKKLTNEQLKRYTKFYHGNSYVLLLDEMVDRGLTPEECFNKKKY